MQGCFTASLTPPPCIIVKVAACGVRCAVVGLASLPVFIQTVGGQGPGGAEHWQVTGTALAALAAMEEGTGSTLAEMRRALKKHFIIKN
jgi:hypothetical protein